MSDSKRYNFGSINKAAGCYQQLYTALKNMAEIAETDKSVFLSDGHKEAYIDVIRAMEKLYFGDEVKYSI